ncbi:hypothetical protein TNIN_171711 [Trichonephila inaurata madagascariensis]|uniref:Uncharacterized protein n=1 Tax=Trichonephila inaurata madagascariensis TaxID=2747483 RepID=A0A8X7C687_9ARAC|nr:hypothetical protein TNIN_171711 [Trichonephila inaurata madagascariensis]
MLPQTRETVRLIETRGFPEIFCKPGSPWQRLYLENAECVNSFAAAAEDVCGYKAMDLVRATPTTEVRQFCRSSIAVRECFVRMIRKACGIIAGDLIKRVVVYGRGDDFVCNKLEKETEDILQKFWFSPATNYNLNSDQTTRLFLTDLKSVRKLPMSITTPSPNVNFGAMHHDHPIAIEIPVTTKIPQFTGYLEDETDYATTLNFEDSNVPEESYFTVTLPFDTETDQSSDEYSTRIPIPRNFTDSYTGQTDTYAMFPPDGEDSNVPEEPQFTETSPFETETDQSSDEYSTRIPILRNISDSYTGQTDTYAMFPPDGEDSNVPEEPQFTETSPFETETDHSFDEYSTQIPIPTVSTDSYTDKRDTSVPPDGEDSNVPEEPQFTVTSPFDEEMDQSSDEYSTQIPIPTIFTDSYTGQTVDTSAMFPPDGEDSNVPEESYFTETSPFDAETDQSSDEYSTTQIPITTVFTDSYTGQTVDTSAMFPPYGMYAYTNFTSFGLYEIMDNGDAFYLGCGTATVQWATDRKLKNVLCGWVHAEATNALFKCNIHLDEACIFEDYENSKNQEINLALRKILLVVFTWKRERIEKWQQ